MRFSPAFLIALICSLVLGTSATEPVDLEVIGAIRQEGFERSRVMDYARHLTEHIGHRLSGSPALWKANEWTAEMLEEIGLDARLERFEFGHGWTYERCDVRMSSPHVLPMDAVPRAWTPGTDGRVTGQLMRIDIDSLEDYEAVRDQVAGKILLLSDIRTPENEEPVFDRYDAEELADLVSFDIAQEHWDWRSYAAERYEMWGAVQPLLAEDGVLAVISISGYDYGVLELSGGGSWADPERHPGVAALIMAAADYNTLARLVADEVEVSLELDVEATFHKDSSEVANTIGEWPGSDLADETVMAGAHLDSWHGGSAAVDNASGVAVVLEALRILRAIGVEPRRTIRAGFWAGEEEGLYGSLDYVERHLAARPWSDDPEELELPEMFRAKGWPMQRHAGYEEFSAYFNIDNGSGRFRGLYAEGNAAVRPIFAAWLAPLADLGAETVTLEKTTDTDHESFNQVGLPGFQFIQDDLDYSGRVHHSDIDTFEHLSAADLKQASVVMATVLYHAAMRDEILPRMSLPAQAMP